jgi:hypothetical protein
MSAQTPWLGTPGARGRNGGRVFTRLRLPSQVETTAQIAGAYPFVAESGLPAGGAYIGTDRFSRRGFEFGAFELYAAGALANPNVFVAGTIGSGKSSLCKTLLTRSAAFGHRFVVPCDIKGEYGPLCRALGITPVVLGAGTGNALNPLDPPDRPIGVTDADFRTIILRHRLLLLGALAECAQRRPLTAVEETALELALSTVSRSDGGTPSTRWRTPTLGDLVEVLLDPAAELARSVPMPLADLRAGSLELALRFRAMVRGSLAGLFDGPTTTRLDMDAPGVVIDLSRVRASDPATALVMTCAQSLMETRLAFDRIRRYMVYDECWRLIRFAGLVRRISEAQKLARQWALATVLVAHRISDLLGGDPATHALALGLLADSSTRIVYNQAADQVPQTRDALELTDVEARLLPELGQGTALWKVGNRSFVVDHLVLRDGMEWSVIQTDSAMTGDQLAMDREAR